MCDVSPDVVEKNKTPFAPIPETFVFRELQRLTHKVKSKVLFRTFATKTKKWLMVFWRTGTLVSSRKPQFALFMSSR